MPAPPLGIQNYQDTGGLKTVVSERADFQSPGSYHPSSPTHEPQHTPGVSGEIFIKFISHRRWTFALHQICQNDYEVVVNNLIPLFIWTHAIISPVLTQCFWPFNAQEYCSIEEHQERVPNLHRSQFDDRKFISLFLEDKMGVKHKFNFLSTSALRGQGRYRLFLLNVN